MNRTTSAVRSLLVTALLPVTVAAGYQHSAIKHQSAAPVITISAAQRASNATPPPKPLVLGAVTENLGAFDQAVRYKASLKVLFLPWGSAMFPKRAITWAAKRGAETVIELQPKHLTMTQIGDGAGDAWLRGVFVPGVAALGDAVTVSFASEMNGQWYAWGSGHSTPAEYVRAWRHIHDLLSGTRVGKLLTWLWQPSAIHFSTPSPKPWWPGSKYVNVIGLDGYYVLPNDTFKIIFLQTIKLMRSLTNTPIMIGETAVGPSTGHQVADIRNLFAGVRHYHLQGLVWFNISQDAGKYHQNWRLQNHPAELREFIAELHKT